MLLAPCRAKIRSQCLFLCKWCWQLCANMENNKLTFDTFNKNCFFFPSSDSPWHFIQDHFTFQLKVFQRIDFHTMPSLLYFVPNEIAQTKLNTVWYELCKRSWRSWQIEIILPVGELNPGLPRDRRGYLPLY